MTREKNYERGAKAEERVRDVIKEFARVESTNTRYPDLIMTVNGQSYGVECKSVLAVNNGNGGRKGNATISSTEMAGMNALVDRGIIPCMIVEIRPPGRPAPKSYFFIDWSLVRGKFNIRRPETLSLTFYWILENGENLRMWLSRQRSKLGAASTPSEKGGNTS